MDGVDMSGDPLARLDGVEFSYAPGHPVLTGVDFALHPGERIGLIGANGSGKTTLLHLLVGLVKPSAGSVSAFGAVRKREEDFPEVRARMGLVFQDPEDQLFCPTVLEDVAFGPLNLGKAPEEARSAALEALDLLGLAGFEDRITFKLSGGEKRLVSLATVLAMQPEVLLLDEPTCGLDEKSEERIDRLLHDLPQSMIIVSHENDFIRNLATRVVRMERGLVVEDG
jgi:cobalt/nickel transport system ATP-binding protein